MSKGNNKKKILVVDDALFSRKMIAKIINKLDYAEVVGEASDGNEAVDLYKELVPDLVTMDLVMPQKDGIEAIDEILKIDKSAIIIVVTAVGQEKLILEATEKGAKDFIQKPFNDDDFITILNRFLLNK
jgi:two-component system chemotaxis response regulator CheY